MKRRPNSKAMIANPIPVFPDEDSTIVPPGGSRPSSSAASTMLRAIRQPTLVVSGSQDTMLPANNATAMFKELSNAQLILYPDSGHGALFQHHEMFVSHVRTFLNAQPAAA